MYLNYGFNKKSQKVKCGQINTYYPQFKTVIQFEGITNNIMIK